MKLCFLVLPLARLNGGGEDVRQDSSASYGLTSETKDERHQSKMDS